MKNIKNWLPAIIVMTAIFFVSEIKGTTIQSAGLDTQPIQVNGHLFMYFVLCISYYKATKNIVLSIVLSVIYGLLDEYHQSFTLLRSPSLFDIKIDLLGASLAGLFLWKFQQYLPENLKNWLKK